MSADSSCDHHVAVPPNCMKMVDYVPDHEFIHITGFVGRLCLTPGLNPRCHRCMEVEEEGKRSSKLNVDDSRGPMSSIDIINSWVDDHIPRPIYNPPPLPLSPYAPPGSTHNHKRKRISRKAKQPVVIQSIDDFPLVLHAIQSHNGTSPIFLYSKKLEAWDVRADQNRILWTNRELLMMEFLKEEEADAVNGEGLKILGVDEQGKPYNLGLKMWKKMLVIKTDWKKMVAATNALKGDSVHIWGFRHHDDKPALAIAFRN